MRLPVASRFMTRTTIDLDSSVLAELKSRQVHESRSLGAIASELLARALAETASPAATLPPLDWPAKDMGARVDIADRDAVQDVLDRDAGYR